jgi:hypothetical protein
MIIRWFYIGFALIAVIGGLITIWLPIPTGVPLLMIGLPVLVKYSPTARKPILRLARKNSVIYNYLSAIKPADKTVIKADKKDDPAKDGPGR